MCNCPSKSNLLKGLHFGQEIINLCVRLYLRYKLCCRDLVEVMAREACRPLARQCRAGCSVTRQIYRGVDAALKTVDFRLSPRRNVASADALRSQGRSQESITLDGYADSLRAVRELQHQGRINGLTKLRSSKYLNNLIEQDHRDVKSRSGPMLGLKSFASAVTTIRGIELVHRIRKRQSDMRALITQGQTPKSG